MADAEAAVDRARAAVKLIFDAMSVKHVVCVDDTYADEPTLEEVIIAALSLEPSVLAELLPELDNRSDDEDVLKDQLRHLWEQLNHDTRRERADTILAAARLKDTSGTDDPGDASILNDVIPDEMLLTLSPRQWDEQREALLQQNREQRTLFLFDQDLGGEGAEAQRGINIIAALLARNDAGALICGLLTHTVTPETQPRRWKELGHEHNIPLDQFLVIPKQYLPKDPVMFAQTLKLLALLPDFAELKEKAKKVMADASIAAARSIDAINIYDLDYIVFQVSDLEGMWEPDMLFRLHALFHRLESRRLAHEGGELEIIARKLRSLSNIPTITDITPESSAWAIQQQELYETAEYLNKNHLPLEVGDIFERTDSDSKKRYVLLAQPCDLMVRKDGKRHPELARVPVAEVVRRSEPPGQSSEMVYFGSGPNERWYVNLKQVHQVRVCILDLCVFNEDGFARVLPDTTVQENIRPAWKARYRLLAKLFRKRLNRLNLLSAINTDSQEVSALKQKLRTELTGDLLADEPFRGKLVEINGESGLVFECRRIGRLFGERALGLLMDYTASLGRLGYDRDFGQTGNS